MIYQFDTASGRFIGLSGVSANLFGYRAGQNDNCTKRGLARSEKYDLVNAAGVDIAGDGTGDWYLAASCQASQIAAFDSMSLSVALVTGFSLADLREQTTAAVEAYQGMLGADDQQAVRPAPFDLAQNHPNPFNPATTIRFTLASGGPATLTVFNMLGQKVRTVFDGTVPAGETAVVWDGRDDAGNAVASGIYLYRVAAGAGAQSRKMVVLK
jgi:hypothetical protein